MNTEALDKVFAAAKFLVANEAGIRELIADLAKKESAFTKLVEIMPEAIVLVKAAQEAGLIPTATEPQV